MVSTANTDVIGLLLLKAANEYGLKSPSSAFQILLGGCKGILVVHPRLASGEVHIHPSMKQFDSSRKVLEVVDCSHPQRANLSHQIITLMSQRGC
ncbi:hypothetical protein LSH36_316g00003 [Paralvinella palmiformis]|uniref:RNA-dependent RNA polymerase n=1 Tax=Paralvinella palmiformis TaxID=53620 RepID=A0AAD9N0P6_9ANNE|nr:hypothetical protein LSH36_316g00003 [Paralvinella palmiformis]